MLVVLPAFPVRGEFVFRLLAFAYKDPEMSIRDWFAKFVDDPDDGRRQLVSLTAAGIDRVEGTRAAREEWLARALQDRYTDAERSTLAEGLGLLHRLTRP